MGDWSSELLILPMKKANSLVEEPLEERGSRMMETMKGTDD